ncbi:MULTISPECIES: flavin monoamine oxidase family protein [Acinetobacter]|jgi:monoamine oxidase|uniref:flavin monoamine oxidase family protein n=1 Tax=Acinetobacter TaxID=469 RepID=UPI002AD8C5A6|nr:FAD-dependent oxidoreductase [Acinetobacter baumannii]
MKLSNEPYDVIVIGAGIAGLKAALELKDAEKSVLILEARDRVGGRAKLGEICGQPIDHGGQWLGAQQPRFREQAEALNIQIYPQYLKGKGILSSNDEVGKFQLVPSLPLFSYWALAKLYLTWEKDMHSLPANEPWLAQNAKEWDNLSLNDWIEEHIEDQVTQDFVKLIIRAILCTEATQTSYLFFLECLRQGQGIEIMADVKGGAQQDKFIGGAWQITKKMADLLEGQIYLNSPVISIQQDETGVQVNCAENSYKAQKLIITAPPQYITQIDFSPALPAEKLALLNGMEMGNVIKMHIAYPKPFWRERGLNGSATSPDRHLGLVFDQSPNDENIGILVGLIEGHHAISMGSLSKAQRKEIVISDLVHYFGPEAAEPLEYVDCNWDEEKWSSGGYAAHTKLGVLSQYGHALRKPFGNIHWAGTETAREFIGYYEGALESGLRAAHEIIESN